MKNIYKLLFLMLWLLVTQFANATQAPWELEAVSVSDTSIEINWSDVSEVLWYYIYYGKQTGEWSDYDIEGVDLIEESNFSLNNLEPETSYYIAITAVDDTGSESSKSPELEVKTLSTGEESQALNLRIIEAQAIDDTSVEMTFSLDMEAWSNAGRQFIIENVTTWQEIWVDISDVIPGEPRNILAILDGKLLPNTQYKITVLDIRDKDGNTIESWIDAFVNFTTPAVFANDLESAGQVDETEVDENLDVQVPQDTQEDTEIQEEDNSLVQEDINNAAISPVWNNAGTTISTEELSGNTLNAAAENESLPQTGPEHWILLLVWVMLTTWIFYKLKK